MPYSGKAEEMVNVDIYVDTDPFDQSVANCNKSVNGLTASVGAMNAAQCLAISQNADKVSKTLIDGFFHTVRTDLSTQRAELEQTVDARLMLLRQQSQMLQQKRKEMEEHYARTSARYQKMFHTMEREYALQKPCWSQVISSTFLVLLSGIYRRAPECFPANRHPEGQMLIFRIQNYLESHLNEDLSLDAVSARFYVDKYHLSHQFTRFTGYSFKQYITSARLSKAKDLLLHSDREIREIAEQVGYHSATHFIRVFKEAEGLSPLQYRLKQREA